MTKALTDELVAEYLSQNTDFFTKNPQSLLDLKISHQSGTAISLVERQMSVMRETNKELRIRLSKLMDIARENDGHFENTKKLAVSLLDTLSGPKDFDLIMSIFDESLRKYLAADEYTLIIFDKPINTRHDHLKCSSTKESQKHIRKLIDSEKSTCGTLSGDELSYLFEKQSTLIASTAYIPLRYKQFKGLLVIGSFKQNHFHKGMGTLFLDYLSDIISRVCFQHLTTQATEQIAI